MKNKNGVMSVKAIIEKITEQIQEGIYPGASLALYRNGQWSEHYLGLADPEKGEPVEADLVYDLASVSKVVGVATICAFLYAKGSLRSIALLKSSTHVLLMKRRPSRNC